MLSTVILFIWANQNANVCLFSRGTFGRQVNKPNGTGNSNQQKGPGSQGPGSPGPGSQGPGSQTASAAIAYGPAVPPPMPSLNTSASFSSGMGPETSSPHVENQDSNEGETIEKEPPKFFFFREKFARLSVKGNFTPLAARPEYVEPGEWLAHQGETSLAIDLRALADSV